MPRTRQIRTVIRTGGNMDLPTKRFYIFPDGPVFKVGLRPALVAHSIDYKVKAVCSNLYQEKKVEVIVNGTDENIHAFWTAVKQGELELPPEVRGYKTSGLEPYEEGDIDWTYHTGALTMEQISTGTKYLKSIDEKMTGIDEKIDHLPERIAKAIKEIK